jgi:serine/threonine protein kinase
MSPTHRIFLNKSMDSPLVIVDFGIAKVMQNPQDLLTTVCGSPGYTAPEVLRRVPYGKEVDIYSCGVICYTLLCGCGFWAGIVGQHVLADNFGKPTDGPFAESKDITEMCDRIVLGQYGFDSPWWDPVG